MVFIFYTFLEFRFPLLCNMKYLNYLNGVKKTLRNI
jgi:hypothetical protein